MRHIGRASDNSATCSHALSGRVTRLRLRTFAVNLSQRRIVDIGSTACFGTCAAKKFRVKKFGLSSAQRKKTRARRKSARLGRCLDVDCDGCRYKADSLLVHRHTRQRRGLSLHARFGRPAFPSRTAYDRRPPALPERRCRRFLVDGAGPAKISQELHAGRAMHASHADCGAKGIAPNKGGDDSGALFSSNLVHAADNA